MRSNNHQKALRFLSWAVFLLFVAPRFRIKLGTVPIYIIDIILLLAFYYSNKVVLTFQCKINIKPYVIFIFGAAILSEFVAAILMMNFVQSTYLIVRLLIVASLFFSVRKIIFSEEHLLPIIKSGVFGAIISAIILSLSSMPFTKQLINNYVFSLSFIEPASENVLERFSDLDVAQRGRSLIGVSILTGAFLNAVWPLNLWLWQVGKARGLVKLSLTIGSFLLPVAIVMTYSRGAVLALLLVILGVLFFQKGKYKGILIFGTSIAFLFFASVGWQSEYFYFERLTKSTNRMLDNPYGHASETERVYAYSEPFEHLVENPLFLFVGQGFARNKVSGHNLSAGYDAATHAVFAASYYGYGMLTAFVYVFLLIYAIGITLRFSLSEERQNLFSKFLLASLLGLFPWFMLGHAAVSQPRGAMLLFLFMGLVSIQDRINDSHNRFLGYDYLLKYIDLKV